MEPHICEKLGKTDIIVSHMQSCSLPPHILYQNDSQTITLIDIPKSIEDAQYLSGEQTPLKNRKKRLLSCKPLVVPYPSLEPKSAKALKSAPEKSIKELMLERYVQLALDEMKEDCNGSLCLDRVYGKDEKKRKRELSKEGVGNAEHDVIKVENVCMRPKRVEIDDVAGTMPPKSTMLYGSISAVNDHGDLELREGLPSFHVIIVDPPWPNRSALRKNAYTTASGSLGIENLLNSLPCHHIDNSGYVGIWVTNKSAFHAMLLDKGGLFDHWGLELVEEWIWLKVTSSGEPIYDIEGTWRKPWEILLVGRKMGVGKKLEKMEFDPKKSVRNERLDVKEEHEETNFTNQSNSKHSHITNRLTSTTASPSSPSSPSPSQPKISTIPIRRRILIGVPDLHSRKPNLRFLFGQLLGAQDYKGLEIFARNMTAGWWGWGNEVLRFQGDGAWVEGEGERRNGDDVRGEPAESGLAVENLEDRRIE
ncbi:8d393b02-7d26-4870-9e96-305df371b3cd [Sclerotinia trifoliorum]|uniref:8d393b02-7d26-4870-9e96-305df371b3cd n=1 Tax=Sclerotinia trifoliorum TaxID=28548 RepID=A0A8H2VX66_9HELO|nr:8d393b02-7d26-4870-9e96-305df371b3cd [Sclerotinia trifoliorum]